jgi:hypothetical protein
MGFEDELHKVEADAKADVEKFETDVENVFHHGEADAKVDEVQVEDDAEGVEKEVVADVETEAHEVEADAKVEEGYVDDAVHHPADAPTDAAEGVAAAEQDVSTVNTHLHTDAASVAQRVEGDLSDAEKEGIQQFKDLVAKNNEAPEPSESEKVHAETPQGFANRLPNAAPVAHTQR